MSNNKKWLIVILYTILLLASLPWARMIWNFIGPGKGSVVLTGLYLGSAGFLYVRHRNIFLIGLLGLITFIIFKLVPIPAERIHFVEYAILGWIGYWAGGWKASFYIIAVGIIDEVIQGILPNRFFDIRDIFMNITGGSIGVILRIYER